MTLTLEQIAAQTAEKVMQAQHPDACMHIILAALQTAAKQPEGAEAWMREAQLFKDNLATHLAAAIQVGELADTDTVYIADLAELLAREHFQIISRHSTAAPAQAQPEGADWAENAAKELADELFSHRYGGIAANYATEKAAFTSNIAAIIRKHAPLVANREDSERLERISKCAGFTICHWHDGYQISRCCTPSDQMTGPKFPTLREALDEHFDAAMRPAQPERGQGEGTK